MSINKAIADSIRAYPTLYRCRTDVLEHWFCTIGNGMMWEDGKLVHSYSEEPRTLEQIIKEDTAYQVQDLSTPRRRVALAKNIAYLTTIYNNADDLAQLPWDSSDRVAMSNSPDSLPPKAIYPLCEYSRMCSVPDDVDPEYLAAVREMIFAVFDSNKVSCAARTSSEQHKALVEKNCEFADKILQQLARRFGDGGVASSYEEWQNRRNTAMTKFASMIDEILSEKA